MKNLVLSLILASQFAPTLSLAAPYPPQNVESAVSGNTVNLEQLQQAVAVLQEFAGTYPPQFDNEDDKKKAIYDSSNIAYIFDVMMESKTLDPQNREQREIFLTIARNAWVAHNLDIKGARDSAKKHYQIAIKLSADAKAKALIQQEYGEFLTSAGWAREGEQVLRQAVKVRPEAGLALGLNLLGQKKIRPSAAVMRTYVRQFPDDQKAQEVYHALRAGTVNFK